MSRVAAIDCGTNSIRLLIADHDPDAGTLTDRLRRVELVRLGQGVDRSGRLAPEAIERTRLALASYVADCTREQVEQVRMVATSATRDASNRDEFRAMVLETLGAEPEVISGQEEAELSFVGAVRGLDGGPAPRLVADIGGGSTELVLGDRDVEAACSMDVGSVRLTERHLHGDPPSTEEIAAAEADLAGALAAARRDVPIERTRTFLGVSGTVTTVAALVLGLETYDPARVHLSRITAADARSVADWALASTRAERAARTVIQPGRVDVIGAGALILRVLTEQTAADEVVVSEKDILDGIAWSIVEKG
jgi:exopolyphosphatase/guanosine-5'-triphosphate,3'-diphosphate pyrophosphatase